MTTIRSAAWTLAYAKRAQRMLTVRGESCTRYAEVASYLDDEAMTVAKRGNYSRAIGAQTARELMFGKKSWSKPRTNGHRL